MNKTVFKAALMGLVLFMGIPHAAGMLGVSYYSARKVVDAILLGLSFWTVISLIAVSGGTLAIVWVAIRGLIRRVGTRAAIAW